MAAHRDPAFATTYRASDSKATISSQFSMAFARSNPSRECAARKTPRLARLKVAISSERSLGDGVRGRAKLDRSALHVRHDQPVPLA